MQTTKTLLGTSDRDRFDVALGKESELSVFGRGGSDLITVSVVNKGQEASVYLSGGAGNDMLRATLTSTDGEDDLWNGITVTLDGGSGDDSLFALNGYMELYGGAGDDRLQTWHGSYLDGGDGNDIIIGGGEEEGDIYVDYNEIYGGNGQDIILCGPNGDVVTIDDDTETDTVYGGVGDDYFEVGLEDWVWGNAGNDMFVVYLPLTELLAEDDVYVFLADTIVGFNPEEDNIRVDFGDISGLEITGLTLEDGWLEIDTNQGTVNFSFDGLNLLTGSIESECVANEVFGDEGEVTGVGHELTVTTGDFAFITFVGVEFLEFDSFFG